MRDDTYKWEFHLCGFACCSRTPGSRQPSPSDEELNKNSGVVVLENPHVGHHYPHPFPPPPHHPHTLAHLESHFEHVMTLDHTGFEGGQQQGYNQPTQQQPTQQQQAMDSPTVLSTSFDVQVSCTYFFKQEHILTPDLVLSFMRRKRECLDC